VHREKAAQEEHVEDMLRYLDKIVEPTIEDFQQNPMSVRHAFLACVVTFHAIDYLAYPRKRPATLRQKFGQRSPDFKIVDEVAHAFKHVVAGNRAKPKLKAAEVISRPGAFAGVMVLGLSRLNDRGGVTLNKSRQLDLLAILKRAVTFLREENAA
jgi:hypothetical protein